MYSHCKDQLVCENADSWPDGPISTGLRKDLQLTERLQVPFIPDKQVIKCRNVGRVLIHSTRIMLGRPEEVQKWQDLAVFQNILLNLLEEWTVNAPLHAKDETIVSFFPMGEKGNSGSSFSSTTSSQSEATPAMASRLNSIELCLRPSQWSSAIFHINVQLLQCRTT